MSISTTSGQVAADDGQRLEPVGRLAHDLEVGLGADDHGESGAHERLVVDDHDPNGHAAPGEFRGAEVEADADDEVAADALVADVIACTGRVARTANPPPARGPVSTCPP